MSLTTCGHESTRGTTLLRAESITGPWVEIAAIETMPELSPTATTDSCTDQYGAGADAWVTEFKTGEFDGGEASFTCNWISGNTGHDQLYADFLSTDEIFLRIAFSDTGASTRDFPYLVKGVSEALPGAGGKVQFTVTGKVNGQIIRDA